LHAGFKPINSKHIKFIKRMSVSQPKESENNKSNSEINPEQALGLVSLGLMQKLSDKGITDLNWLKEDEKCDFYELRQRLELTSLAIETGAPLSTSEVSKLLGVRPGTSKVERGGLTAKKISRNVWKLVKSNQENSHWRN
tara:strand:- start:431 stop:850 length:420 start_codon:yes stop_codon:yes gene_type:complete